MDSFDQKHVLREAFVYKSALEAYAFGILKNWVSAQDAVQEGFLYVSKHWQEYRADTKMFSWLRAIVRFECLKNRDKNWREVPVAKDTLEGMIHDCLENSWGEAENNQIATNIDMLRHCLSKLPQKSSRLIAEHYASGYSYSEIEKKRNWNAGIARKHLYRARQNLKRCMNQRLKPDLSDENQSLELLHEYYSNEISPGRTAELCELFKNDEDGTREVFKAFLVEWAAMATVTKQDSVAQENGLKREGENNPEFAEEEVPSFASPKTEVGIAEIERSRDIKTHGRMVWVGKLSGTHFIGIAACLILVAGLSFWMQSNTVSRSGGFLSKVDGEVFLQARDAKETSVKEGQVLAIGDRLRVSGDATCTIAFDGETTTFAISSGSSVTVLDSKAGIGKKLELTRGEITASVARQVTGESVVMRTPHAEITVLGTRFRLIANPRRSTIVVNSGRVSVSHFRKGTNRIVTAGNQATVDEKNVVTEPTSESLTVVNHEGLIARYGFDEGQGEVVLDSSPGQSKGSFFKHEAGALAVVWVDGRIGKAVSFRASQYFDEFSLLDLGVSYPEPEMTQFSLSFWLKYEELLKGEIESERSSYSLLSSRKQDYGWTTAVLLRKDDTYRVWFALNDKGPDNRVTTSASGKRGEWAHFSIVFDQGMVRLYLNGMSAGSKELANNAIVTKSETMRLGPITEGLFPFSFDELLVFDRSLNQQEVLEYYNASK